MVGTLVGKKAPEFKAKAVVGKRIVDDFSLSILHLFARQSFMLFKIS